MDWTSDPYKAAFFAFSGIGSDTQNVAIYVFRERTGWATDCKKTREPHAMTIGPYIENTSDRHLKQEAQYTWCVRRSSSDPSLDSYVFTNHEPVISLPGFSMEGDICVDRDRAENVVDKYTIPASERRNALASLARRNINRCTLFGTTPDDLLEDLWNELAIDSAVLAGRAFLAALTKPGICVSGSIRTECRSR